MQKKFGTDKNIHHIKNNKYSDVNIRENQNQFLTFSRTQSNIPYKKNYVFSTKYTKNPKKPTLFKNNTNVDNTITYGNKSSKNLKNSYLSESNDFNNSNICFSKGTKYKNVIEKSKTNQKLSSIPLFNLMQNFNINSSNSETENVNDEIYPNEKFEIKIPENDQNLIINNNIELMKIQFLIVH